MRGCPCGLWGDGRSDESSSLYATNHGLFSVNKNCTEGNKQPSNEIGDPDGESVSTIITRGRNKGCNYVGTGRRYLSHKIFTTLQSCV